MLVSALKQSLSFYAIYLEAAFFKYHLNLSKIQKPFKNYLLLVDLMDRALCLVILKFLLGSRPIQLLFGTGEK